VSKTVNGLLKLLYPDPSMPISDDDLEWAVRMALECRRRVKEQQKRIGSAEFRNTQFSYQLGLDGIEQFVSTPELQGGEGIGTDPLPPGQVWGISPGSAEDGIGLYRIDVAERPGSGVRFANVSTPNPMRDSLRFAEQNLYSRAKQLVGDRDPRQHELMVQFRALDTAKSGADLGVPALLALSSALLGKSLKGGLISAGQINLGGAIEPLYNAVSIAELAIEKGATTLLIPVASRRQLIDLSDDMAAKLNIVFYTDAQDALLKALLD
jgi:ATP-dependent Lon protease